MKATGRAVGPYRQKQGAGQEKKQEQRQRQKAKAKAKGNGKGKRQEQQQIPFGNDKQRSKGKSRSRSKGIWCKRYPNPSHLDEAVMDGRLAAGRSYRRLFLRCSVSSAALD